MRRSDFGRLTGAFALLVFAAPASALTVTETADAGATMDTAVALPDGTTAVDGTIVNTADSDIDIFSFSLDATTNMTMRVLWPSGDANLLLFDSLGRGLAADDDDNSGCADSAGLGELDSCLTISLAEGAYYLAVGSNNMDAFETEADWINYTPFLSDSSKILSEPTSERLGLVGNRGGPGSLGYEGLYTIEFSSPVSAGVSSGPSAVPLPGALPLMAAGIGAFAALKRRRRT